MTHFNKSTLIALATIVAMAPAFTRAADTGTLRWLDGWRHAATPISDHVAKADRASAVGAVDTKGALRVPARQRIPGVNCSNQTIALAVAQQISFHGCIAAAPRSATPL
jgi:hypothetical protein